MAAFGKPRVDLKVFSRIIFLRKAKKNATSMEVNRLIRSLIVSFSGPNCKLWKLLPAFTAASESIPFIVGLVINRSLRRQRIF